jgi:hypothetical protein
MLIKLREAQGGESVDDKAVPLVQPELTDRN